MKTGILILTLVLALSLILTGVAAAGSGVELTRQTLGSGVTESAGGTVTLQATLGQPLAGNISGGDVSLQQGFWHTLLEIFHQVYLPLILR